jgi:hypothetical protein
MGFTHKGRLPTIVHTRVEVADSEKVVAYLPSCSKLLCSSVIIQGFYYKGRLPRVEVADSN